MRKYDTDIVMRKLWLHLARDFSSSLGTDIYLRKINAFVEGGVKELRAQKWPARSTVAPYVFKCDYQLESLFKRYRFKTDLYTDEELYKRTMEKFMATQQRISIPFEVSSSVDRVLREARRLCKEILGEFSQEEVESEVRFGNRACFGHPYSRSYLDQKLSGPLTGSAEHIAWFKKYLASDHILSDIVTKGGTSTPNYVVCDALAMSLVPKSFKSLRPVKPQTLIGTFYTNGLGSVLTERLKRVGLDIRRLQNRHRRLVEKASRDRILATADLSAASDSISFGLLERLLPQRWLRAVMFGVSRYLIINGTRVRLSSVATMGDGHTFPLQTLIFYCLLKAIGNLLEKPRMFVSVYGDDLIYPRAIHKYVERVFNQLHFVLNGDKTYVQDFFRESCGSDFYRGFDVRPFSPEGVYRLNSRHEQAMFLYKLYNGLSRRWDPVEIPETLSFLTQELILVMGRLHQVPPSYPDGAGVKVDAPIKSEFFEPVMYASTTCTLVFRYLRMCPDQRVVSTQHPYYWEALRTAHDHQIGIYDDIRDVAVLSYNQKRKVAWVPDKHRFRLLGHTGSTSSWT